MHESFRILFYENGDPVSPRCIKRLIWAFPGSYRKVVESIIKKSGRLDEEAFGQNVARLIPSFGMARRGAFHGVGVNKKGTVIDEKGVIDLCWKQIGNGLLELRNFIDKQICKRGRVLVSLAPHSENYVIEKTSKLFRNLRKVDMKTGQVSPVGASKVLFAALPEIALPVDNAEWKHVFRTTEYRNILSTMVDEIKEWETKTKRRLEKSDPYPKATLPGIYNVMAMSVRDMLRTMQ